MRASLISAFLCCALALTGCSGGGSSPPKAPTANPGGPYSGHPDFAVTFSGGASIDPQSQALTYAWNFGDGTTGAGVNPTHTYSAAGSFTVSLAVTDTSSLNSAAASTTATITNQSPAANAGGPYTAATAAPISFTAAASTDPQGSALTYAWNFGDSSTAAGVAPTHAYASPGTYPVTLTVTDARGLSATAATSASITAAAPTAKAGGPYTASLGSPVNFTAAASTDPNGQTLTYAWNFGDGITGTGVNPSHFYTTGGPFTATLTVTDTKYNLTASATAAVTSTQVAIQPMTNVVVGTSGYFPDPLPIHLTPGSSTATQYFSGTNLAILSCTLPVTPGCYTKTSITIDDSLTTQQAAAFGTTVTASSNHNIYQDNAGNWQMATTLSLSNPGQTADTTWSVICHAHPTNTGNPVPTTWQADTLLVGSLSTTQKANYDGKFFEDSGNLYLLYSMAITTAPALHDGVVAQLMVSATQPATTAPVILIDPDTTQNNGAGFNSEYFFGLNPSAPFKLVETGNITLIDGKYALAYSTGSYQQPWYKTGVAWSDTFLPALNATYQKVFMTDTAGVWGTASNTEVEYLLQSQEPQWPDYVAAQVLAPGVPSFVNDNGTWYLYFAGYNPTDAPPASGGFDGSHRRPYYVPFQVNIPTGATVSGTSPYSLGTWITPVSQ